MTRTSRRRQPTESLSCSDSDSHSTRYKQPLWWLLSYFRARKYRKCTHSQSWPNHWSAVKYQHVALPQNDQFLSNNSTTEASSWALCSWVWHPNLYREYRAHHVKALLTLNWEEDIRTSQSHALKRQPVWPRLVALVTVKEAKTVPCPVGVTTRSGRNVCRLKAWPREVRIIIVCIEACILHIS